MDRKHRVTVNVMMITTIQDVNGMVETAVAIMYGVQAIQALFVNAWILIMVQVNKTIFIEVTLPSKKQIELGSILVMAQPRAWSSSPSPDLTF